MSCPSDVRVLTNSFLCMLQEFKVNTRTISNDTHTVILPTGQAQDFIFASIIKTNN